MKGQVAEVYNRLLATLRACFVELESRWLAQGILQAQGDIFFLTWSEIQDWITENLSTDPVHVATAASALKTKVELAKHQWQEQSDLRPPYLVYGQPVAAAPISHSALSASDTVQGIGASAGQIEGTIRVLESFSDTSLEIDQQTILVVPYTDAGWSPLLARIGGLISEVGGQLSHGAIVAREYGIPAVMDVTDATRRFATGQRVRIDGQQGTIEIIDSSKNLSLESEG